MGSHEPRPVRIKYYGVLPLTRAGYWIATALAGLFAVAAVALALAYGKLPPFHWPWQPVPWPGGSGLAGLFYNHLYEILAALVVLEVIDIWLTMRRFDQKEAEQRARFSDENLQP